MWDAESLMARLLDLRDERDNLLADNQRLRQVSVAQAFLLLFEGCTSMQQRCELCCVLEEFVGGQEDADTAPAWAPFLEAMDLATQPYGDTMVEWDRKFMAALRQKAAEHGT